MAWCFENLRDCQAWCDEGLAMSSSSNEEAKLFDGCMRQYVSWTDCEQLGGIEETAKKLKEDYPEFLMGQVLNCGLTALGTGCSIWVDKNFKKDLEDMCSKAEASGNEREKMHATAVSDFAYGNLSRAAEVWEAVLKKYPTDLLAVKFAHDTYFYLGDKLNLKQSTERAIRNRRASSPCSSFLYGMYAFGLEECGNYVESEKNARLGLEMQPRDAWATHAVAHCMEMTGRYNDGIAFMESTVANWQPSGMLACHNFWHTALYYIEKEDFESALTYFDSEIGKRSKSGAPLDIVDAASLLLRLEMEGINVGNRWDELLKVVRPRLHDHVLAFNDAHYRMVFERCSERALSEEHRKSIANYLNSESCRDSESCKLMLDCGERICESVSDYCNSNYGSAVGNLFPIRKQIYRIGGSHAQRDVFTQLLIRSAIRAPDFENMDQARAAILERNELKKNSPLGDRFLRKLEERVGATKASK